MDSLQKARQLIEALPKNARVIELAGPTPSDNEFLQNNKIHLHAKPLVTNRENPALFYGLPPHPKKLAVDEIADVRHLTYKDVDMFLCSYLTQFSEQRHDKEYLHRRLIAGLHYKLGYTKSKVNLHISLFRETAKALRPNGLLLIEGLFEDDFAIAKKCGFILVYRDDHDAALFQRD